MTRDKKAIDVAWIPTAEALLGKAEEPQLLTSFMQHRSWLRDQNEQAVQQKALSKIDQVYQSCEAPISCAAGCSACCHARVDVSKHEKRLILSHLKQKPLLINKTRLAVQYAALQQGSWDQLPFADRQCVLLDDKKCCTIYESRPLLCRRYFVTSDQKHCGEENWSHIKRAFHPDTDAFLSAVFTKFKFEALPVFLTENLRKIELAWNPSA